MESITYAFPKRKDVDPSCYIDAYTLVLQCSQAHTPRSFTVKLLDLMMQMCPYDQALVIFMDVNGKVSGWYAKDIEEELIKEYMAMDPKEASVYQDLRENSGFDFSRIIEWDSFEKSEYMTDYIRRRGIKYSWGFCFFDLNGSYRVIISLDRSRNVPFSEIERTRVELALPILNNMHRNFFYQGMDNKDNSTQSTWRRYGLTPRESEIADLLCQGMSVQNISFALYIAVTTAYKHIAHIYEKLGVSSQQELLVKLLGNRGLTDTFETNK